MNQKMPEESAIPPERENQLIRQESELTAIPVRELPVINEIVGKSLMHIQTSKTLGMRHRIGEHELYGPDYRLVCAWAEELQMASARVMELLLQQALDTGPIKWQTKLVDGRFRDLRVDDKLSGISGLPPIKGLVVQRLSLVESELNSLNISALADLRGLSCRRGNLIALNLSELPKLEFLDCSGNELTELDLSGVPNLQILDCSLNKLTRLDLSKVPNLAVLRCCLNRLQLDLSEAPNLVDLDCSGNLMDRLNLSGAPMLKTLRCHDNRLADLDLTAVPDLINLDCESNNLTELDIRPLRELEELSFDKDGVRLIQRPDQSFG